MHAYARPTAHQRSTAAMAEKEITKKEGDSSEHGSESMEDLLERIRQLEEDNQRKDDEIRHRDYEVKRLKKENDIFRKILRTRNIDADDALAEFSETDADSIIEELRDLRRKVGMNSGNSSLPPSSDRPWQRPKKRSLRQSTGRRPGGQIGHPGTTITVPHEADKVIMLYPPGCENCQRSVDSCHRTVILRIRHCRCRSNDTPPPTSYHENRNRGATFRIPIP